MSSHPSHGSHTDPTFRSAPRPAGEVVRRVGVYLKPYKGFVAATIGCAVLSLAFGFLYPKLVRVIIDDVIGQGRRDLLTPVALGLLGSFLLREAFNSVRIRLNK